MKYIKLKVKYVILILAIMGVMVNYKSLQIKAYQVVAMVNEDVGKQLFVDMKVSNVKIANAKLENVLEHMNASIYNPVIMENGMSMMSGERIRLQDAKEILIQYNDFKRTEKNRTILNQYAINVSLSLWFGGLSEEAITVINEVDDKALSEKEKEKVRLIKAGYELSMGQLDDALLSLEGSSDYYPNIKENVSTFITLLKTNTMMDYDIDRHKEIISYTKEEKALRGMFGDMSIDRYRERAVTIDLSESSQDKKIGTTDFAELSQDKKISGYVTVNGQPVQGAMMYLDNDPYGSGSSSIILSTYIAVTDDEGYYELPAYEARDNYVGLGISWQLVNNKQFEMTYYSEPLSFNEHNKATKDFAFNQGAYFKTLKIEDGELKYEIVDPMFAENRSYRISISYVNPEYKDGNTRDTIEIPNDEMKGSLPINQLKIRTEIPFAASSMEDDFELYRFLEPLYLSEDYYFEVRIDDDKSGVATRNGMFSKSLASVIYVEGDPLSVGDLLLKKGNMEEAMSWYEEHLSPHSLKILTALYDKGYIQTNDENYWHYEGRDVEKAIIYAEKLLALDEDHKYFLSKLQSLYKENGDDDKAMALLQRQLEMEPDNKYLNMELGKYLINQGRFNEGVEKYLQYGTEKHDYDRYYPYLILANQVEKMDAEYQRLYQNIDTSQCESLFKLVEGGEYEEAKEYIDRLPQSDLKIFYSLVYKKEFGYDEDWIYEEFIDYYRDTTNSMSDKYLKEILKKIVEKDKGDR